LYPEAGYNEGAAIKVVRVSPLARKSLKKVPRRIFDKLETWVAAVERDGLEMVRKIPGYHDDPLPRGSPGTAVHSP
jgi:hypothetical protein